MSRKNGVLSGSRNRPPTGARPRLRAGRGQGTHRTFAILCDPSGVAAPGSARRLAGRPRLPRAARTPAQHTHIPASLSCCCPSFPCFLPLTQQGEQRLGLGPAAHDRDPRACTSALAPLYGADLAVADSPLSERRDPAGRRSAGRFRKRTSVNGDFAIFPRCN